MTTHFPENLSPLSTVLETEYIQYKFKGNRAPNIILKTSNNGKSFTARTGARKNALKCTKIVKTLFIRK